MSTPELPRGINLPNTISNTVAPNAGAVNAMARTGVGHALEMTTAHAAPVLGNAIDAGIDALPVLGVVGVTLWGLRKVYQGLFGISPTSRA